MTARWIEEIPEIGQHLPENCILDKGITGCGATSLAITNDRSTLIAAPTVNLIKNKMQEHPDLLGVYGGVTNQEIADYLKAHDRWKIMATYDAIPRIADVAGAEIYSKAFLLVDEYHRLLFDYPFRHCWTIGTSTPFRKQDLSFGNANRARVLIGWIAKHPPSKDYMTECRPDAGTVMKSGKPVSDGYGLMPKCHCATNRFQPALFREQRDIYRQGDPPCETDTRPSKDSLFAKRRELWPQQREDRRFPDKYTQRRTLQNQFLHLDGLWGVRYFRQDRTHLHCERRNGHTLDAGCCDHDTADCRTHQRYPIQRDNAYLFRIPIRSGCQLCAI